MKSYYRIGIVGIKDGKYKSYGFSEIYESVEGAINSVSQATLDEWWLESLGWKDTNAVVRVEGWDDDGGVISVDHRFSPVMEIPANPKGAMKVGEIRITTAAWEDYPLMRIRNTNHVYTLEVFDRDRGWVSGEVFSTLKECRAFAKSWNFWGVLDPPRVKGKWVNRKLWQMLKKGDKNEQGRNYGKSR